MAEGASLDNIESKYQSQKENGRYIIPWGGNRPTTWDVCKWVFREKDNSSVGGTWKSGWKFKDKVDFYALVRSKRTYNI